VLRYRYLFEQMVRRELRQKYKGSALGVLWYLINPIVLMGAYLLVFSVLLRVADIPDYPLFVIAGMIVWVFFAQAMLAAAPCLELNAPLVRKVRFPRQTIPASAATVQLATFLVMLVLLLPVELALRGTLEPALLLLPVVVALLFAFVLGLSLAVSVLHAHYRDVEPVVAAALLPWFFVTPIFLRVSDLPGVSGRAWLGDLIEWGNPVAPFVSSVRELLYAGSAPSLGQLGYLVAAAAISMAAGVLAFRRLGPELAVVL
jgi:homopolymeric O-antigen transport system permease protein